MRTFTDIKELPVFETSTGDRVGLVCDLSIANGNVTGLIVKTGSFFKQSYYLDLKDILSFGHDGIMVTSRNSLQKQADPPENTFARQNPLQGKVLMNQKGDTVGLLKDVYFLEELGTIVGYEYTDGLFSELSGRKQILQSVAPPAIGKDAIIVDDYPM